MTLVIRQVQIIYIINCDTVNTVSLGVIPTDKINGILEIITVGAIVSSASFILLPGAAQRLRIAVGVGRTETWNNTKNFLTRWLSLSLKSEIPGA